MENQKTTGEIQALLSNAELDFDSVVNKALNNYLPKIFQICPFTEDICTTKQCLECEGSKKRVIETKFKGHRLEPNLLAKPITEIEKVHPQTKPYHNKL